jgi:hypothetical protein
MAERLKGNIIYMEGNKNYEDLYLMSLCYDNICSNSTLSWWGAWLNSHHDKVIVCLKEWVRPGYTKHDHLTCDGWIEVKTVHSFFEHYCIYRIILFLKRAIQKMRHSIGKNNFSFGS